MCSIYSKVINYYIKSLGTAMLYNRDEFFFFLTIFTKTSICHKKYNYSL